MWQRLRNGWLDDQVSGVAKRTIGLNSLTVGVRVSNLNNPGKGEKCTAEEAQSDPPRTTDSRIPAALQHAPIIYTQSQITQFAPASCLATCEQVRALAHPRNSLIDGNNLVSSRAGHFFHTIEENSRSYFGTLKITCRVNQTAKALVSPRRAS
jgi:hypothetical protein